MTPLFARLFGLRRTRVPTRLHAPWLLAAALLNIALLSVAGPATAGPAIPDALKPWVGWALDGADAHECVDVAGNASCAFSPLLTAKMGPTGGTFEQTWAMLAPRVVRLPGNAQLWPQDVTLDGKAVPVLRDDDVPHVRVPAGRHVLKGRFLYTVVPEKLDIAAETAQLTLDVNGERVRGPRRDGSTVWLSVQSTQAEDTKDALTVYVHRKLVDDVPARLVTAVELEVSGKAREVGLGPVLPAGFIATELTGSLPATYDATGILRVQLRPGTHKVHLTALRTVPVSSIQRPAAPAPWPAQEVWSLAENTTIRVVDPSGPSRLDPQHTRLPSDWRTLPAFSMLADTVLTLKEQSRGARTDRQDALALSRTMWLDDDGRGMTVQDTIGGQLGTGWRLRMPAPAALGSAKVSGQGVLITQLSPEDAPGIEVRDRTLNVEAVSRLATPGLIKTIDAVGWAHDVRSASWDLRLPSGWELLHASGPDTVSRTKLSRWSLLDIFVVFVLAIVAFRLFGAAPGALVLVALLLTFVDRDAPQWLWAAILVVEAVRRAVPERWAKWFSRGRAVLAVMMVLVAVPYAHTQIKNALQPVVRTQGGMDHDRGGGFGVLGAAAGDLAMPAMEQKAMSIDEVANIAPSPRKKGRKRGGKRFGSIAQKQATLYNMVDPDAVNQTGPGVPLWSARGIRVSWTGPVTPGETVKLYLLSPLLGRAWAFAQAACLLACLLVLWRLRRRDPTRPSSLPGPGTGAAAVAATAVLLFGHGAHAQNVVPPDAMLKTLKARVTAAPECAPDCGNLERMTVTVDRRALSVDVVAHAAARVAVPLPGKAAQWSSVRLNGQPANHLRAASDGHMWIVLEPGVHKIRLLGDVGRASSVELPLAMQPAYAAVRAPAWDVGGVSEAGVPSALVQLVKRAESGATKAEASSDDRGLTPFFVVERTLELGITWQIHTTVRRISPTTSAAVIKVARIPGASITTDGVVQEEDNVVVTLPPSVRSASWSARMTPQAALALVTRKDQPYSETWTLDAARIWNVQTKGVPGVAGRAARQTFYPFPGETLNIAVTRPKAVKGQTLTVQQATLRLTPGHRLTDAKLDVTLQTSRGEPHPITLPDGATVQKVTLTSTSTGRSRELPIDKKARQILLPLSPGEHNVAVEFRLEQAIGTRFETPAIDLGAPGVNLVVETVVPDGRWLLGTTGPRRGPVVRLWSALLMFIGAALLLSRTKGTLLSTAGWVLLSIGLLPLGIPAGLFAAGWFFAVRWRAEDKPLHPALFALRQLGLVLYTAVFLGMLLNAVREGLLSDPSVQVMGNGSTEHLLRFTLDRSNGPMPTASMFSVDVLVYRALMLAWAAWLATQVVKWMKAGFAAFTEGGAWRPLRPEGNTYVPRAQRAAAQTAARAAGAAAHAPVADVDTPAPDAPDTNSSGAPSTGDAGADDAPRADAAPADNKPDV